ncbi:MAG: arginine repressor [Lachnospiraceae bacterium]|nr:arginine repressor [Lachnospiraceae bacterium]
MKNARQSKIIELVTSEEIGTQEELADKLKAAGFAVTQATVSRDIRQLQLSKANIGGGRQKYVAHSTDAPGMGEKYNRALKDSFISVQRAVNMVVIKTFPGMAMSFAAALDALDLPEIIGSIAGDDTIMCATAGEAEAEAVVTMIKKMT